MSNPHALTPAATVIVRLYRRDPARVTAIAGLAEDIATGQVRSFRDGEELLRLLQGAGAAASEGGAHADD